jgi:hypothetical protein
MRVVLATHGGQAAAINMRLPPRVLDSDRLPPEAAAELRELVAAARAEEAPEKAENARDAMSYTVTVDDGGESATITASDTAMSPAFAALLSWLQKH